MDALTSVLLSMRLSGEILCRSELRAPWGLVIPELNGAAFHIVVSGKCRLDWGPRAEGLTLAERDVVVVSARGGHRIANATTSRAVPIREAVERSPLSARKVLRWGGSGARTVLICGQFRAHETRRHPLFGLLPPVIHLRGGNPDVRAQLEKTVEVIVSETRSSRPGSEAVAAYLTGVLFVQILRIWLETLPEGQGGWLGALREPVVGKAIEAMITAPQEKWTVARLGATAGAGRSNFTERFKSLVGMPPLEFLTEWRMQRAAELMHEGGAALAEIAERVGYSSEVAFFKAFKRERGVPPGAYRRVLQNL